MAIVSADRSRLLMTETQNSVERNLPAAGSIAPEFTLTDSTGVARTLTELCAVGPLILVFYRGHW